MTGTADYEAVVYDLDGTLVHLDVDWAAVEREVAAVLADAGLNADGLDTWAMFDVAAAHGLADEVESVIAAHERAGAETADRLPLADRLPRDVPVGVCSLNCEAACRTALDVHDLADHVHPDAVVGRDTVGARKPDPAGLAAAVRALGASPETALFVGDSASDETTARRAGVDFAAVEPPWDEVPEGSFRDATA